jgi:hypothetical protein
LIGRVIAPTVKIDDLFIAPSHCGCYIVMEQKEIYLIFYKLETLIAIILGLFS